jgi:hypothetical protein
MKMGNLIRNNSIAEDLNRLNVEERHSEEERAVCLCVYIYICKDMYTFVSKYLYMYVCMCMYI